MNGHTTRSHAFAQTESEAAATTSGRKTTSHSIKPHCKSVAASGDAVSAIPTFWPATTCTTDTCVTPKPRWSISSTANLCASCFELSAFSSFVFLKCVVLFVFVIGADCSSQEQESRVIARADYLRPSAALALIENECLTQPTRHH